MKITAINHQYNKRLTKPTIQQSRINYSTKNFYTDKTVSYPSFCKSKINVNKRYEIIKFLSNSPEPIAQGTDGTIYKKGDMAIKVAKEKETSFESEAEILKKLPKTLGCAQHYIDRFCIDGKDVLVSSFVDGTHKKQLEAEDIEKIFDVILAHDKANIMHGDLNLGNIMFSEDGNVSFIDYGAATQPTTTEVELYPSFVVNTNALKFENTGINDSLKACDDDKELSHFKDYLKQKASFYEKHAKFLTEKYPQLNDAIEYETNLASVLRNPSDAVIETELRRITTLDLLETADTAVNYDNNPHSAIKFWNSTVESAKDTIKQTQTQLMTQTLSCEERKYFENQKKIAQSFYSTLSQWRNGTFDWLYKIREPYFVPSTETEKRIKENWACL